MQRWMAGSKPGHDGIESSLAEARELLHHPLIGLALERHNQVGKVFHRLPAPFDEFRIVAAARMCHVDLAVVAGEAQREPFLLLATVLAIPGLANDLARNVVAQPLVDRAQAL